MKLFEKPLFRWKEPRAFLQQKNAMEQARRRWWHMPLLAGGYFVMLLGTWALATLSPGKEPPPFTHALPVAVAGALLFAYGLPWLVTVLPSASDVRLFSPRIVRTGMGNQAWDYSAIQGFEWVSAPGYHVLLFKHGPNERVVSLGLPPEMDTEAVTQFLISKGIPHSTPVM